MVGGATMLLHILCIFSWLNWCWVLITDLLDGEKICELFWILLNSREWQQFYDNERTPKPFIQCRIYKIWCNTGSDLKMREKKKFNILRLVLETKFWTLVQWYRSYMCAKMHLWQFDLKQHPLKKHQKSFITFYIFLYFHFFGNIFDY